MKILCLKAKAELRSKNLPCQKDMVLRPFCCIMLLKCIKAPELPKTLS
jgi:hypothetical protein